MTALKTQEHSSNTQMCFQDLIWVKKINLVYFYLEMDFPSLMDFHIILFQTDLQKGQAGCLIPGFRS